MKTTPETTRGKIVGICRNPNEPFYWDADQIGEPCPSTHEFGEDNPHEFYVQVQPPPPNCPTCQREAGWTNMTGGPPLIRDANGMKPCPDPFHENGSAPSDLQAVEGDEERDRQALKEIAELGNVDATFPNSFLRLRRIRDLALAALNHPASDPVPDGEEARS